jgi:hypothetical protein
MGLDVRLLDVLVAAFGAFMLLRHGPRAVALLRGRGPRAMGVVSLLNVVLAVAILAVAVKGLMGGLISR